MAASESIEDAVAEHVPDGADVHVTLTIETVEVTVVDGAAEPGVETDDDPATDDEPEESDDATDPEPVANDNPDVDPDDFDRAEVRDYANGSVLYLGSPAGQYFNTERVHVVRTEQNDVEVRPGGSEEWPDYTVGASAVQIGKGGIDILGVSVGDEVDVHAKPDRGVLVLNPVTISGTGPNHECDKCGTTFKNRTSLTNHQQATACGAKLPDDMTAANFEEIVAGADTVTDVKQALRINRTQVEALLEEHGLADEVVSGHELAYKMRDDEVALPEGLTEGDVHAVAEVATSVEGAAANMEVSPRRAEKILRAHNCINEVRGGDAGE